MHYSILLKKLNSYGFRGLFYNWLKSHLGTRLPAVSINNSFILTQKMFGDIIQGSTFDPFLFLIYVNKLFANIDQQALVYAGDITILILGAKK